MLFRRGRTMSDVVVKRQSGLGNFVNESVTKLRRTKFACYTRFKNGRLPEPSDGRVCASGELAVFRANAATVRLFDRLVIVLDDQSGGRLTA